MAGKKQGVQKRRLATIGIDPEAEARERLIAAAPELLAVLLDCLPDLAHYAATHGPGPDRRLAAARAAIAKATGAEPGETRSE